MPRPPAQLPTLTNTEILDVERWAMQGAGETVIATLLGMPLAMFRAVTAADERVAEAMMLGRARGIEKVGASLFTAATSGRDTGAARFFLERVGGEHWTPPRAAPPVIIIQSDPPPADKMIADMQRRFARQSALLDGRDFDAEEQAAPGAASGSASEQNQ